MNKYFLTIIVAALALSACGEVPTATDKPAANTSSDAQALPAEPEQIIKVSALELSKAYEENEAAGDASYKGKKLEVSGTIRSIEKGMFDETNVMLRGKNEFLSVIATLADSEQEKALKLKKKSKVTLQCTGGGEIASAPVLKDCIIM